MIRIKPLEEKLLEEKGKKKKRTIDPLNKMM